MLCADFNRKSVTMEEEMDKPCNFHTCEWCPYRSKLGFVMSKHLKLHGIRSETDTFMCNSKAPEIYDCGLCEFETDLKVTSSEHFRVDHEEKEANDMLDNILQCYQCKNCNFQTHSIFVLTKHVNICDGDITHSLVEPITNNVAPAEGVSDQWYEFKSEGAKQWSYYKCRQCSFQCSLLSNIKKHVKSSKHLVPNDEFLKCEYCPFRTKTKQLLETHVLRKHEVDVWIECEHCSYVTADRGKLKNHVLTRHTKPKTHLKCEHCSYMPSNRKDLKEHVIYAHPDSSESCFKCEHCTYMSSTKKNLRSHIVCMHAQSETCFKCEQCPYASRSKRCFQQHVLHVHTKLTSCFTCEHCSFKTGQLTDLRAHNKHAHKLLADIDWFKCTQCKFKTKTASYLKIHIFKMHGTQERRPRYFQNIKEHILFA